MIPRVNVCIDYLKFEVLRPFRLDDFVTQLFKLMRLNPWRFDSTFAKQFGEVRIYGCNTRFMLHPDGTAQRKDGLDYWIVEMSGSACRDFESRGCDWKTFLDFILHNSTQVFLKRADLALDDLSGIVPLDELKDRVSKERREYITRFRKFRFSVPSGRNDGTIEDSFDIGDDGEKIIEGQGWSATWGSKASAIQLQIYDKLAEREANDVDVNLTHWVRFEMRFLHCYAKELIFGLCKAFDDDKVGEFAKGLLRGMFVLVDNSEKHYDRRNYYKLPLWKPYEEFLGDVDGITLPFNQDKVEVDAVRRIRYLHDSVGSTLKALSLVDPTFLLDEIGKSVSDSLEKNGLLMSDMSKANRYRKAFLKASELSDQDLIENLKVFLSLCGREMPDDIKIHRDYSHFVPDDGEGGGE